jgi:IclR family acetate operon transcriptional repressor
MDEFPPLRVRFDIAGMAVPPAVADAEHEVGGNLGGRPLERFTDRTVTTLPALPRDIQEIRSRGWSIDDEEHTLGMRCIAAPVFNEYAEAVAGISISGPAVRLPQDRIAKLGPEVRSAADALTRTSGARRPVDM